MNAMNFSAAAVEIYMFIAACAALVGGLFVPPRRRAFLHWGVIAALLAAAAAASFTAFERGDSSLVALGGFFTNSPAAAALKGAVLLSVAACLAFSRRALRSCQMLNGDFYGLAMLAALGMLVMVSAAHFLSLYLGLELMSLCLYALIGMKRGDGAAYEAAIKYFVLGALASGLFLYGVSMLYGATGELQLSAVAAAVHNAERGGADFAVLSLGLVFVLAGMAFKLGAAPFHMWLPDVYHGAPAPVTLFIAAAPKIAAVAMLARVLGGALDGLAADWRQMLMILAVFSLAVGNITAIAQTNLKRMLAYSSIAHAGFIVLGLLAGADGARAAMFYVCAYALMTVGGFGAVVLLSVGGREKSELADLRGMAGRNIVVAVVVALLMLSMAGVPPTVGFVAKLAVLQSVVQAGFVWLVVLAVLFSLVGAFYYLRVIRLMFFEPSPTKRRLLLRPPAMLLLAAVGFLVLWFGVFPGELLEFFEEGNL